MPVQIQDAIHGLIEGKYLLKFEVLINLNGFYLISIDRFPVLPGRAKPSLPLQPEITAILAHSTATYHKFNINFTKPVPEC
jgi:hypothetical protein